MLYLISMADVSSRKGKRKDEHKHKPEDAGAKRDRDKLNLISGI